MQLLLVTNVETMFVHPLPALWYTLTLSSMEKYLKSEESNPIDTMLKGQTQKINIF